MCLPPIRSWLERQQNCPTCRSNVFTRRALQAPRPPAGAAAGAAPGAAAAPDGRARVVVAGGGLDPADLQALQALADELAANADAPERMEEIIMRDLQRLGLLHPPAAASAAAEGAAAATGNGAAGAGEPGAAMPAGVVYIPAWCPKAQIAICTGHLLSFAAVAQLHLVLHCLRSQP